MLSVSFLWAPGPGGRHVRMPTPSRSSWRRSRWNRHPLSSNCWRPPSCHVTLSLRRWVRLCNIISRKPSTRALWAIYVCCLYCDNCVHSYNDKCLHSYNDKCVHSASQIPSCFMVQMPRFGNRYKMFPHIVPSTELDITDLLYNCE